eukprot:Rhum_TRINITY_DN14599_c6_g2::Rhum_TRINITY_DN14599_c6_g2_i1::g.102080::m.102080
MGWCVCVCVGGQTGDTVEENQQLSGAKRRRSPSSVPQRRLLCGVVAALHRSACEQALRVVVVVLVAGRPDRRFFRRRFRSRKRHARLRIRNRLRLLGPCPPHPQLLHLLLHGLLRRPVHAAHTLLQRPLLGLAHQVVVRVPEDVARRPVPLRVLEPLRVLHVRQAHVPELALARRGRHARGTLLLRRLLQGFAADAEGAGLGARRVAVREDVAGAAVALRALEAVGAGDAAAGAGAGHAVVVVVAQHALRGAVEELLGARAAPRLHDAAIALLKRVEHRHYRCVCVRECVYVWVLGSSLCQ